MKKVFVSFLLLLGLSANAQIQEMKPVITKGDAMLGTKDRTRWICENAIIDEPSENLKMWTMILISNEHIFERGGSSQTRIGFYNDQDSLIGMVKGYMSIPMKHPRTMALTWSVLSDSVPYSRPEIDRNGKKIYRTNIQDLMTFMRETKGYIRVIAPLYQGYTLDFKFRLKEDN